MNGSKYASVLLVHYGQIDPGSKESRSEILRRSIESLLKNTDYPAELIVLDNGGNPDDSDYFLDLTRQGIISTYLRYHDNMSFAFAWNQAARIATGDYLVFTCNDLEYHPGWLSSCIQLLEKYPERKFLAAPYITPDKNRPNFNKEVLEDGARVNSMAGSNCMVITMEKFRDIGDIPHHRIGGSIWYRKMTRMGYLVVIPPKDMVTHLGYRNGVVWQKHIEVKKTLLNGDKVDFSYGNYQHHIFRGVQRTPGIIL